MTPAGLSSAEAQRRLSTEGSNALPAAGTRNTLAIALAVLGEPMLLLLIAAAGVYLLLGEAREALVLGASVLVVIAITVTQERKSERALEALRDLSSPRALVVRDGEVQRIAGAAVVRGDLLVLAEGDRVPADATLTAAHDLMLDESLLTGESLPVDKRATSAADHDGQVFSGTLVVKGQAQAEVFATGSRTALGRIGVSLATIDTGRSGLQQETGRVVQIIAIAAVVLCAVLALSYALLRGDWLGGVLAGLTLAMAILPEEFPLVLTVFLALGAWRISRRGVLTRRIPAVEMLGATTVLCVDKTGTLTENRMHVAQVFDTNGWREPDRMAQSLLHAAALACEIDPFDPMERAILQAADEFAPAAGAQRRAWRLDADYPLQAGFLAVCHGWLAPDGTKALAIKGAPETVLALCAMDADDRARKLEMVQQASTRGLRVLAVAQAPWQGTAWAEAPSQYAWRWLGFVALADPLRAAVPQAVAELRRAGIRVAMITGDHPGTAIAIARAAGLMAEHGVLTGAEIAAMSDDALVQAVSQVQVFARITPGQKLRLVKAYQARGEVVAMTGDGVNDAPALKAAHIGVAMGQRGTDVAREASALVLLKDDFGAIVDTVRLGRRIYRNIRNAMRYLIAVHVPTVGMAFIPLALGWPLVLFPLHVVFLEFIIDPACTIVFEAEAEDARDMSEPPRAPSQRLFDLPTVAASLAAGAAVLLAAVAVYGWAQWSRMNEGEARALTFATIVLGNLALILVYRAGGQPLLAALVNPNRAFWWIVAATLGALALAIYVPTAAQLFRFEALSALSLTLAMAAGAASLASVEGFRRMRRGIARR